MPVYKRLFLVTAVVIFLCGVASAQSYSIRVTHNTNLRASASLQARIVETAPAGTTLQVIEQYNRWLKISRNPEVWMADWVPYERVEDTGSQQQESNIDNCCFVDRQCTTDQDWTDGYWAFQNGQCTAPTQTQTQTLTQVTTTVSSQIDNCCFVDRQCNSDAEWTAGYLAFQNNLCAAPAQSQVQTSSQPATTDPANVNNCCFIGWQCNTDAEWSAGFHAYQSNQCEHPGVAVEGSDAFRNLVADTFGLLRSRSPGWYDYVVNGLDKIVLLPDDGVNCSCVDVSTRTFYTTPIGVFGTPRFDGVGGHPVEWRPFNLSGAMAHEACHVYQWQNGIVYDQYWKSEQECLQKEVDLADAIDFEGIYTDDANKLRNWAANLEDPALWWWAD